MKSLRSHLEENLGANYKPGDDLENLLQYALKNGAPIAVVSVTPKAHSTGMRLISILSLNLVLLTSTIEAVMGVFNRSQTLEDSTTSETKFEDILTKANSYRRTTREKMLAFMIEGDYSAYNRKINPNDLFSLADDIVSMIFPGQTGLSLLISIVQQQFCRKLLMIRFSEIAKFTEMIRDDKCGLSEKAL